MKILEISPYEPPASGWVTRIKLLRRIIEQEGGTCEILDIGPNRKLERPDCISVMSGPDFVGKVVHFSRRRFTFHCHINGEYFRGMLLAMAALLVARSFGNRCVTTFHAGTEQDFFNGWKKYATWPFYVLIFSLSHSTVCNSDAVKEILSKYQHKRKIESIPAFSRQYLEYREVELEPAVQEFIERHSPIVSTYICLREGFFIDIVVSAFAGLVTRWPNLGLLIVGTGTSLTDFCDPAAYLKVEPNLLLAGDLDHDTFLTVLSRTDVSLRTPVTDGVSATVLEALALRIPVVASNNGGRPKGVVTYIADSAENLSEKLNWTMLNRDDVIHSIPHIEIPDTATEEIAVLRGA